ncbi:MAG: 2-C-methyl-D-erythritol 2,4-cyclodiphosphate synthase [Chitinivibrionales bacterium]|nr:2-C-methyl-D-erythritol 2,4-cyclodiphosphate synthase [Chitinivibrionales bacterium]
MVKVGCGQDSHRFEPQGFAKKLRLAAIEIPHHRGLDGNSDADVVLHALTNAISGISGVNILGAISDRLCLQEGITDSRVYLQKALETLVNLKVAHISVSIECSTPKLAPFIDDMKRSLALLCGVSNADVGITATSGEGLTAVGRGEGIAVVAVVTTQSTDS